MVGSKLMGAALVASLYLCGPCAANADAFNDGKTKEAASDYTGAFSLYQSAANAGDVRAMMKLGEYYKYGKGTAKSGPKAREWYEKAFNAGEPGGATAIAEMYYYKDAGTPNDPKMIHEWAKKAAEAGDDMGAYWLATSFESGDAGFKDLQQAANWYKVAADTGHGRSQARLNKLADQGYTPDVMDTPQQATGYLNHASFIEDPVYKEGYALYLADKHAEALALLEPLARAGNTPAMILVGDMYETGRGTERDEIKAAMFYWKAGELGMPQGKELHLALEDKLIPRAKMIQQGDYDSAIWLYNNDSPKYAAQVLQQPQLANDPKALYWLGRMHLYGEGGLEHSTAIALGYLERASALGNRRADMLMGDVFIRRSTDQEKIKGIDLYVKAANGGLMDASLKLSSIYQYGQFGLVQSYEEAEHWLRLAASQGSNAANFSLEILQQKQKEREAEEARLQAERDKKQIIGWRQQRREAFAANRAISGPGYTGLSSGYNSGSRFSNTSTSTSYETPSAFWSSQGQIDHWMNNPSQYYGMSWD